MKYLCSTPEHRCYVVSAGGGIRMLLKLVDLEDETARNSARQALAQICIVTNPQLFQYSEQLDTIRPLVEMLEHKNELFQFEAAMGLTNLLIVSPEVRSRVIQGDGWRACRDLLFSENTQVQRAGLEAMCNLTMADEILERFAEGKCGLELKIFSAFSLSDDRATQIASTGALAMLSGYDEIAKHVVEVDNFNNLFTLLNETDDEDIQKRLLTCLGDLLEADSVNEDIKTKIRGALQARSKGKGFVSAQVASMLDNIFDGQN